MGLEIERKFLLLTDDWKNIADQGTVIKQGYLNTHPDRTVRIRIKGNKGIITVKGRNVGATRSEYEYEIPLADAQEMMLLCEPPIIEKVRYLVVVGQHTWEIDVFEGVNDGLVVAEMELGAEDEDFAMPDWVGEEVTFDVGYYNSNLIQHPFQEWKK